MNDNFDDYDFAPSTSSNLASLFDSSSLGQDNSSLIYTAPKQPKPEAPLPSESKTQTETSTKGDSSVICARVVQVWRLVDNKHSPIGKHGLAIIGSTTHNSYEMILYKERQNVIVRLKINTNFQLVLKKQDFIQFYDNSKQYWLIKFNSSDDSASVLNQIEKLGGRIIKEPISLESNDTKNITTTANSLGGRINKEPIKKDDSEFNDTRNVATATTSNENKAKADILTRIAKMGQSILPSSKNNDPDDSEDDSVKNSETSSTISNEPNPYNCLLPTPSSNSIVQIPPQTVPNTVMVAQPHYDPFSLYLAESRAQNSELRLNIAQISDKLSHVMKLVDNNGHNCDNSKSNDEALKSKVKVLDLRIENLVRDVGKYQEENAKLKLELSRNDSVTKIDEEKNVMIEQIAKLEQELDISKTKVIELTGVIDRQKAEIEELESKLENNKQNENGQKSKIDEMEAIVADLKQQLSGIDEGANHSSNSDKTKTFVATLKESMNAMYGNILGNLVEDKKYSTSEMNGIIAQNIKNTTLKIIQNCQQIYMDDSTSS